MIFGTLKEFNKLRKTQWFSSQELKRLQEKKLRAIVSHAYRNVEFYHRSFRSLGIYPDDIKSVEDLQRLPIVTKSDIQKNFDDFIAKDIKKKECKTAKTSGSMGMPLTVLYDKKARAFNAAVMLRPFFENGLRFYHKFLQITDPWSFQRNRSWYEYFGIFRWRGVSIQESIKNQIGAIKEFKPDFIYSSPSNMTLILETLSDKEIENINPRVIFTSYELLSERNRKLIKDSFNADVIDLYGSTEFYRMAWECDRHEGHHIDAEGVVIEFVRDRGVLNSENGDIIVTGLNNYAMPLIRYRIGDVGAPIEEQCSCGRGLPLMKEMVGRSDDFLVLPSGRRVSPRSINVIEYIHGIKEYRIVQEKRDRIVVYVVKGKGFSQQTLNQIKKQIRKGCQGEDVGIEIEIMGEIPRDKSGKLRTVISKEKDRTE